MKRSLEDILHDQQDEEEEAILHAELIEMTAASTRNEAEKKLIAKEVASINSTIEKWDEMGLRSAAGSLVTPPRSQPFIGCHPPFSCPLFLSSAASVFAYLIRRRQIETLSTFYSVQRFLPFPSQVVVEKPCRDNIFCIHS